MCMSLQEGNFEQANAIGFPKQQSYQAPYGYQGQPPHQRMLYPIRRKYDSHSSVFNSGWKPHPNFHYVALTQSDPPNAYDHTHPFQQNRQPQAYRTKPPPPQAATPCQSTTLKDLVKAMAITQSQIQQS